MNSTLKVVFHCNLDEIRVCYAFQDLSQPKSEASPPDGDLAVPLLRHQVCDCFFSFNISQFFFLECCCLELSYAI